MGKKIVARVSVFAFKNQPLGGLEFECVQQSETDGQNRGTAIVESK